MRPTEGVKVLSDAKRRLVGRLHRRKPRAREGLVLVEGVRCVVEALAAGARGRFLVRSPGASRESLESIEDAIRDGGIPVYDVPDREMALLAGTETPQGVLLVAEEPATEASAVWSARPPRVLLLDGVQDPGNVGTLIRAAAAFACSGVVALDGTADPWSPRAVRAASGTTFRLPVVCRPWSAVRESIDLAAVPLLVADADGNDVRQVSLPAGWVIALGGEGAGCRKELQERSHASVSIPMPGGVESLNVAVAGAILLYELALGERT